MKPLTKDIFICVSFLLVVIFTSVEQAAAQVIVQPQDYTLSEEALAAAKRFSSNPKERAFADLEVVLIELQKVDTTGSVAKVEYQEISLQQLIDLLGPPAYQGENGQVGYGHSFGRTAFFFEGGKLKNFFTLGEPNYWIEPAYPRYGLAKRTWYRAVGWSRKVKSVFTSLARKF